MWCHRTNNESDTKMSSHCSVRSSTPSKISQNANCSAILPLVLSWNSLTILVQEKFPNRSELLVCFTIYNFKTGCDYLNQERLCKFECISINLTDIHSKILIGWPFILQHKVFISSAKQLNWCINLIHRVTNNNSSIHICENNASLTKEVTWIDSARDTALILKPIAQFCKPTVPCLLQAIGTLL